MTPATHGDGLRFQRLAADVVSLRDVSGLSGVVVLACAARNGPGVGILTASPGAMISWQGPGGTAGDPQLCSPDGAYLLLDGADPSKWVRIQVYSSYLPATGQGRVFMADVYNNFGPSDSTAAESLMGQTITTTYGLNNVSPMQINNIKVWLDPATSGLEISRNNVTFVTPTSESDPSALTQPSLNPTDQIPIYVRRTIAAASVSDPKILNVLQFAWDGF
jgi:hypothetical protein